MLRKEISVGVEITSNGFFVSSNQKNFLVPVENDFFCVDGLPTDTRFLGHLLFSAFQKEFINLSQLQMNIQMSVPSSLWEQISFVVNVCDSRYLMHELILEFQEKQQLNIVDYYFQYDLISCCDGKTCLILGRAIKKHYVKIFEDLFSSFKLKKPISIALGKRNA
jgi:hypothetical protein